MSRQERIDKTKKRISFLELELIHRGYLDGWTIRGYERELKILKDRLNRLNSKK